MDRSRKRQASSTLENETKRLKSGKVSAQADSRITDIGILDGTSDSEQSSDDGHDEYDEDGHYEGIETPLTPFSPAQKLSIDAKKISCPYVGCTKAFNRPARLTSHLRSHTNERPFKCSYDDCDKAYLEDKHLKQHVKAAHLHERSYSCEWEGCGKAFLTATRLRRHEDAHKGRDRFKCTAFPPCIEAFRKHQTLQRHIRSDHLDLCPFPCTHIDAESQKPCTAGFDSSSALKKHEDRAHGSFRFFCQECTMPSTTADLSWQPQGFRTKADLTKHLKRSHINCLFCELSFPNQSELNKHTDIAHSAAKTRISAHKIASCTYPGCGKSFSKKSNLDAHFRTAHLGERFICASNGHSNLVGINGWDGTSACGKTFVAKANLEDHVRTQHLGLPSLANGRRQQQTPTVKEAGQTGLDVIEELTGQMYVHDTSRNIPCVVPECAWLFTRKYDLSQHLRSRHDLSESAVGAMINEATNPSIMDNTEFDLVSEVPFPGNIFSQVDPYLNSTSDPINGPAWSNDVFGGEGMIDDHTTTAEALCSYLDPAILEA